ncbi:MAG: DUF535 family protein [Rickettsiales bacterium]|nr:DUF535 family protein [Rickettsiales bacterium]
MSHLSRFLLLCHYTKIVWRQRGLKKSRIFFLRSLMYYFIVVRWLEFIDGFYKKYGFTDAPWSLAGLPVRAYVSTSFSIKERLELLINNYQIMAQFFSDEVMKKILTGEPITLSKLIAKDEKSYNIILANLERYWREGGLTIYLTDEENEIITTLTFNFGKNSNRKIFIIIGGLQGTPLGKSNSGKSKIVAITRGLRGLRPKYALLDCCYSFAKSFAIDLVIGVSNKNHVFAKQEGKINASYNEFWQEIDGKKIADGNFQLPAELPKRDFSEVPQKKRKDWLARQEYLKKLNEDISAFLKL